MKEYLKEPDEYSSQRGKWGILNREQRTLIKRLLKEMDSADIVIKNQFEEIERLKDVIKNKHLKEIERLNNIINEFEEELKWQRKVCLSLNEGFTISRIDTLINKLQELKGDDSNEL